MKALFATLLAVFVLAWGLVRQGAERATPPLSSLPGPAASLASQSAISTQGTPTGQAEVLATSFLAFRKACLDYARSLAPGALADRLRQEAQADGGAAAWLSQDELAPFLPAGWRQPERPEGAPSWSAVLAWAPEPSAEGLPCVRLLVLSHVEDQRLEAELASAALDALLYPEGTGFACPGADAGEAGAEEARTACAQTFGVFGVPVPAELGGQRLRQGALVSALLFEATP